MPARRSPKIEALIVNAIRRLQDVQGSSSREISNYISQEYDVPAKDVKREIQLTLQRGLAYGILQRSNRGYYTCNRDYPGQLPLGNEAGDGVTEPCSRWRFIWRAVERRRRRERKRRRERSRVGRGRRRSRTRSRRGRRRTTRSRGNGRRRRRRIGRRIGRRRRQGRSRRRGRSRSRRRRGGRSRRRGRGGRERSRRHANLNEMGTEAVA